VRQKRLSNVSLDSIESKTHGIGPAHVRFFKFLAVGGFSAAVNFFSRIAFSHYMRYSVAIVFAYLLGMVTAFVLNRLLVFRHTSNPLLVQASWFIVVNAIALLQTLGISLILVRWGLPWVGWNWQPELVAHAVGVTVPVVTSYFGHKRFSFR
jgi:putative flippase GtrA